MGAGHNTQSSSSSWAHIFMPFGRPTPSQPDMRAAEDPGSDGHFEEANSSSTPPDEPTKRPHTHPDTDAIIRETRAEIKQAHDEAAKLMEQFAKEYVAAAGQLREEAIQRYRARLEGLPPEACAEVCETLAEDDEFCQYMDFGDRRLSVGGLSLRYQVQSDEAFNALSHHAWKDCELNQTLST
jgi:hypothetical protein